MSNKKTKGARTPKLRFPEFQNSEGWGEKSIQSVCQSFSGGTPLTSEKDFYGGEIPFIRSAEIDKDRTELFLTQKGLENSAAKLVKTGDVLVALYGANSGDVALARLDGAINQAILCLRSESSNPFIYQFLHHKKEWLVSKYIQGGQGNLSGEIIKSVKLPFPKDLPEQQKIADCLTSLDDLITLQSQKVDALKAYKKGLLQNLFPAEGETVPALRFPEFEDAEGWEEKVLSDLNIYISDGNYGEMYPKAEEMKQSGIPFIRANNIKDSRLTWDDMKYIDADLHELLDSGHLEENDILVTTRGNIGMVAYVTSEFHGANINAQICLLRCGENLDSYYLLQYLLSDGCYKQFMALQTGSALKQLPKKNLGRIEIKLPSLPEQQKIAELLTSIDEAIAAQSQRLAALQVHKKGLLQGLFPSALSEGEG